LNLLSSPAGRIAVTLAVIAGLALSLTHNWGCDVGLDGIKTPGDVPTAPLPEQGADDPLLTDARAMAESLGIPVEDAYRRLQLQGAIGELDARLTRSEASTFSGLYIEQGPSLGIVVLGTTSSPNVSEHLPTALYSVSEEISCRRVDYTLRDLRVSLDRFSESAPSARFDASIELEANRIFLTAASQDDAEVLEEAVGDGQFEVPASAFVVEVGPLAQPG
jgi:hypothetical protein